MDKLTRLRWLALSVFLLSSALNYLDRSVLSAIAPSLLSEFSLNAEDYGRVISAFYLTYTFSSPVLGWFIDRVGLTVGACIAVALWSLAGIATGFAGTLGALLACRAVLGFAEAGGIPGTSKAAALYLPPESRAMGAAVSQFGLTLGMVAAPRLSAWLSPLYGWRSVFFVAGALGFVWIPLWILTARKVPPVEDRAVASQIPALTLIRDRRFIGLVCANVLAMVVYGLWTQWTTLFLVRAFHLTEIQANRDFAWIPPIFATAGGLLGGWLALRMIRAGAEPVTARLRIALFASMFVLASAAAPLAPTPALATAAISMSLAAITCLSVNYYSVPLDLFGAGRAAFSVSFLTSAYGILQYFLSPWIGRWSETVGWQPVCLAAGILPLCSVGVLRMALR